MWGVIPVAGRGSRLQGLTGGAPKCLVEVGGRPLLHHLLDQLVPLCADVCVVVPPDEHGIDQALRGHPLGRIAVKVVQPAPTGLADAVDRTFGVVEAPVLVVMGDTFHGGAMAPQVRLNGRQISALFVEDQPPIAGEPAGWVLADEAGYAEQVWKSAETREGARRIAGGFVLGQDALDGMPRRKNGSGFEEEIQRSIENGARYRLIELDYPRWNVNTPEQLEALRLWYDGQASSPER